MPRQGLPSPWGPQDFLSQNEWQEGTRRVQDGGGVGKLEKAALTVLVAEALVWKEQRAEQQLAGELSVRSVLRLGACLRRGSCERRLVAWYSSACVALCNLLPVGESER